MQAAWWMCVLRTGSLTISLRSALLWELSFKGLLGACFILPGDLLLMTYGTTCNNRRDNPKVRTLIQIQRNSSCQWKNFSGFIAQRSHSRCRNFHSRSGPNATALCQLKIQFSGEFVQYWAFAQNPLHFQSHNYFQLISI